jgi:hypothetical protein
VTAPRTGVPTVPGRRGPSARADTVISVSVMPYRSTGRCPVSAARSAKTAVGNGALPETSSRAGRSARAAAGAAATRPQTVGTPKNSVPPAAAYASARGRPVWVSRDPVRSAPSTPRTSPCTW